MNENGSIILIEIAMGRGRNVIWNRSHGEREEICESSGDVLLASLNPFDTILLQTDNSDYRILLIEPSTGRSLIEGGHYLAEPAEAFVRGSAVLGDAFKTGAITVGSRLEMWVDDRVYLTSIIKSVHVNRTGDVEPVENVSEPTASDWAM